MDISQFGWDSNFEKHFVEYANQGLEPARVFTEHKNIFRLYSSVGELLGEVSGKFRYNTAENRDYPVVGDWVAASIKRNEGKATIHAILPRKSCFSRKSAGTSAAEQNVAANFDIIFIMMSLNKDFNLRKLERYLVLAWNSGASPVVILSKADLCSDVYEKISLAEGVAPGVPIYAISSSNGTGIEDIKKYLKEGLTIAILGSSGVGKSTFVNTIAGEEIFKTQEIREGDDRGKHTTTHRQLVCLSGGAMVIDTPGMREVGMSETADGMGSAFSDIDELALGCRFKDCEHTSEPGCAVIDAIKRGQLGKERFMSYLKLQKEAAYMEAKQSERVRQEQKKRGKQIAVFQKNFRKGGI